MRIALVSDSHGELVALEAVLRDLGSAAADQVVMAGDIAQGGPQPAETLDRLVALGWPMVRGNADDLLVELAAGAPLSESAGPELIARGRWSVAALGPERIRTLAELPFSHHVAGGPGRDLVVVHSTPWSNREVVLPSDGEEVAGRVIDESGAGIVACGHIHSPYARVVGGRLLLSVGAVASSNDVDPRPCYTILEVGEEVWMEVRRVECSIEDRIQAYSAAGLEMRPETRRQLTEGGDWPIRASGRSRVL